MIDSIGSSSTLPLSRQSNALVQTGRLRDSSILTAVQQAPQRVSNAVEPVKVFAVTQTSNGTAPSQAKLPRGSLVDVWA
ncbi:MAG: hypothetical protein WC464_04470 [Bdellovibrionales bacterium]